MFGGMTLSQHVNFILVLAEGFLSFFSPCVLPLIPVYISYLAGNGKKVLPDGTILFDRKKVLINTLFFVAGISCTFFILGLSFSALGSFFIKNRVLLSRVGGIIIIILGLVQLDLINLNFLKNEKKINYEFGNEKMNIITAFIMGFTFSFAWTPCVGPVLSSVLILASSAESSLIGNLLILVYTLGFVVPFIMLGIFTTQALSFFKNRRNLLKYTIKSGGIILIIIGIMTITGTVENISKYLSF